MGEVWDLELDSRRPWLIRASVLSHPTPAQGNRTHISEQLPERPSCTAWLLQANFLQLVPPVSNGLFSERQATAGLGWAQRWNNRPPSPHPTLPYPTPLQVSALHHECLCKARNALESLAVAQRFPQKSTRKNKRDCSMPSHLSSLRREVVVLSFKKELSGPSDSRQQQADDALKAPVTLLLLPGHRHEALHLP